MMTGTLKLEKSVLPSKNITSQYAQAGEFPLMKLQRLRVDVDFTGKMWEFQWQGL